MKQDDESFGADQDNEPKASEGADGVLYIDHGDKPKPKKPKAKHPAPKKKQAPPLPHEPEPLARTIEEKTIAPPEPTPEPEDLHPKITHGFIQPNYKPLVIDEAEAEAPASSNSEVLAPQRHEAVGTQDQSAQYQTQTPAPQTFAGIPLARDLNQQTIWTKKRLMIGVGVLGILFTIILIVVFASSRGGSSADLSAVAAKTVEINDVKLGLKVPTKLDQEEDLNGVKSFRYTPDKDKKGNADKAAGQIVLAVTDVPGLDAERIQQVQDIFDDTTSEDYKSTNDATKKTIEKALATKLCVSDTKIVEPKSLELEGADFSLNYPFSCHASADKKLAANGYYIISFVEGKSIESLFVGIGEVWASNIKTWDSVAKSIKIEQ